MPRSRKTKFYKKKIDDMFKHAILYNSVVLLTRVVIEDNKLSPDKSIKKDGNISEKNNTPIDEEPVKKRQKLDKNGKDNLKLEFSEGGTKFKSKVKSPLRPNKEIASTSAKEVPMVIDCATESVNTSAENVKPKIWVKDAMKLMEEEYLRSCEINNNVKNHVKWNLNEIQKIHSQYFDQAAQVNIVTIANILNVISMSNEHLKARLDKSAMIRSAAKKIRYTCDARRLHKNCNTTLETKLTKQFITITSSFEESEFYSAFIMFFLSVLTVLRVMDQPKFGNCQELFKIVKKLLPKNLINDESNHPKIFSTFQSITFYSDCTNLLSVINDSRDTNPEVTDRMPLYFLKTAKSLKYFKSVIGAVTCDSTKDLSLLIESAIFKCFVHSGEVTTDPVVSSTLQHSNNNIPVTKTIQSPINSNETNHQWILAENQNGTYPDVPVLNGNTSQVTTVEPSIVDSQPSTSFYKPQSSSLQNKTSKVTPTTISNSPLVQVTSSPSETATLTTPTTTCGTLQPITQNENSVTNGYLNINEHSTIVIDNKPYQLVMDEQRQMRAVFLPIISNSPWMQIKKSSSETSTATITTCQSVNGPSGQMTAVDNGTLVSPPIVIIRCDGRSCKKPATITCKCKDVNYCSNTCRTSHWYEHYADCRGMKNKRP